MYGDAGSYQIQRSLRCNSSDSAYLSRTPAVAGNRRTWTFACWLKRSKLGAYQYIFCADSSNTSLTTTSIGFNPSDKLEFASGGYNRLITTQVFRDTSAWYHILVSVDTTQVTPENRYSLYVNGSKITALDTADYIAQNTDTFINVTDVHTISRWSWDPYTDYFSGYLTDIQFIDGQALTPSSFTEVSATTGQLVPKAYTGSFGTNGFWLKFSDNSAATATTLGKDYSGNSNNWTPNNLSVTAGAGNDSLVDTPTSYGTDTGAGGEVRGNYATLNPLQKSANVTLANGNLDVSQSAQGCAVSTIGMSSQKWYAEYLFVSGYASVGICTGALNAAVFLGTEQYGWSYASNGYLYHGSGYGTAYGASYSAGDIIGVAFDATNGTLTFYKNNTSQGVAFTGLTTGPYFFAAANDSGQSTWNFGQRAFAYTAPTNYQPLVDTLLTAPLVAKPSTVMDVKLYTGNGSTQAISGLGFSPDLVWIKARSTSAYNHFLLDTIRGVNNELNSNTTDYEYTRPAPGSLTAFNSDGFNLNSAIGVNANSTTYAAWCWDAGTSTVTNTQGSITSSVRANQSAGFSIVTYTGTGAYGTVGHGLNVAPGLLIAKNRSVVTNWIVWHSSFAATDYIALNLTGAKNYAGALSTLFTGVSSTTISIGSDSSVNANNMVIYAFSPVAGYSSFGSYTGNGSTDGPFVYTGFRPRWVMIKYTSGPISDISNARWLIVDSARNTYNVVTQRLEANSSGSEITDTSILDFTSNGFKIRWHPSDVANSSGATYIYAAFAENPFQFSRAR